ncbi:MAG: hypothetical protein J1F69_06470 [Clostridiales bacterium]|nr:hypothetical protein [Clostridiales bacterium]
MRKKVYIIGARVTRDTTPTAYDNKLSFASQSVAHEYCAENAIASKHSRLVYDARRLR